LDYFASMSEKQLASANPIRAMIEDPKFKSDVALALPAHLTPERFIRIALTATTRTPNLLKCDEQSIFKCLMQLSQFGLEPDGRLAHLIPFWNSKRNGYECQLIIDYKGLATLARRSGQVSVIHASEVRENDQFEYNKGVVQKHVINFKDERGPIYAYYAFVRFKDGSEQADCMDLPAVLRIKERSRSRDRDGKLVGPWVTDEIEMGKKTVFRRLSKWLDLSPEYREALEADADALEELRFENAQPTIARPIIQSLDSTAEAPKVEQGGGDAPVPTQVEPALSPKKKPKAEGKVAPTLKKKAPSISPLVKEVRARLRDFNQEQDLIALCQENNWIDKSQDTLEKIEEERLKEFLLPNNWEFLMQEMEKLAK
jgi:recombination protein RecT